MSEAIPSQDQNIEKQELWNKTIESLKNVTDGLGTHIEESIIEAVAAMNINGFPTDSSCGGHLEADDLHFPYLQGHQVNQPKYRYSGEEEIRRDFLRNNNIASFRDVFSNDDLEKKYYDLIDDLEETQEYRDWYKNNLQLIAEVQRIINEFAEKFGGTTLHLSPIYANYRIEAHDRSDLGSENLEDIKVKIVTAQGEFKRFTEFLKERFFGQHN